MSDSFVRVTSPLRFLLLVAVVVASLSVGTLSSAATAGTSTPAEDRSAALTAALAVAPQGSAHFLAATSPTRSAGRLNEMLAGMNRAQFLLGADPVDQLMGLIGFPRHVDRFGVFLAATAPHPNPDVGGESLTVILAPSKDPQAFIDVNFEPTETPGQFMVGGRIAVYARPFASHVALGTDPATLTFEPLGDASAANIRAALPTPVNLLLARDDLVGFSPGAGMRSLPSPIPGWISNASADASPVVRNIIETHIVETLRDLLAPDGKLAASSDGVAVSVRFDPLALVARSSLTWTEPVELDLAADVFEPSPFAGLNDGPMLIAAGLDCRDTTLHANLIRLRDVTDGIWTPARTRYQFMALRDDQLVGGLFGSAAARLSGAAADIAEATRQLQTMGMTGHAVTLPGENPDEAADGPVRFAAPADAIIRPEVAIAHRLLYGASADAGMLTHADNHLLLVRSAASRSDDTIRATTGLGSVDGKGTLATGGVVGLMRTLYQFEPSGECLIDVAACSRMLGPMVSRMAGMLRIPPEQLQGFEIRGELPPVGIGLRAEASAIDAAVVIPAQMLTILFDRVIALASAG